MKTADPLAIQLANKPLGVRLTFNLANTTKDSAALSFVSFSTFGWKARVGQNQPRLLQWWIVVVKRWYQEDNC